MTVPDSASENHLSNDWLVRALDDELSGAETLRLETHLLACPLCRARQAELRRLSDGFESFVKSLPLAPAAAQDRAALVAALQSANLQSANLQSAKQRGQTRGTGALLLRFGWFVAAAATLALALSYSPFSRLLHGAKNSPALTASAQVSPVGSPFEIDGETFQYLPYSNPDLPLGGSHVVQMQVPLSSLADAGVLVVPTANRLTLPDRSVLADVVLGLDGQPIGVHVLSADM